MRTRTPWSVALAAFAAAFLVVVVALAYPSAGVSSFVVRISEFAIAAGAAYLLDDAAAAVTVAAPRTLWRRRAPTLTAGLGILAVAWVGILLVLRGQASSLPVLGLTGEVAVLCCVAVAAAAVLSRRGEPEPGGLVAAGVVLLGLTAVVAEPLLRVEIFVPAGGMGAVTRQLCWVGAAVVGMITVLVASGDPAAAGRRHGVRLTS